MESVRTKRGLGTPFLMAGRSVKQGVSETTISGTKLTGGTSDDRAGHKSVG
jgi:hypothetical protein